MNDAAFDVIGLTALRAGSFSATPTPWDGAYALFLYAIVRMRCAGPVVHAVEIGTYQGFGSVALRRGQVDGGRPESHLWLVDPDHGHARATATALATAGIYDSDHVHVLAMSGVVAADHVPDGQHVVIDDDGHEPDATIAHLQLYAPKLAPGGIYLMHDVVGREFDPSQGREHHDVRITRSAHEYARERGWPIFEPGGSYLAFQRPVESP